MINIEENETDWNASEWNPANFEEVMLAYQPRIFNFLYSMLKQKPLAEDITQETFFLAYRNLCNKTEFNQAHIPVYKFSPWLYTIARNAAISELRRRRNISHISFWKEDDNLSQDSFEINAHEMIKAPARDIDRQLDIHEELKQAIQKVGRHNLMPLLLQLDGYSYNEICRITNTSLPCVKTNIFRAKIRLRNALNEQKIA